MIYAIGMKGWVELRSCVMAPRAKVTKVSKVLPPVKKPVRVLSKDGWGVDYVEKMVSERVEIISTVWVGGKVIECVPARDFALGAALYLRPGTCQKVQKERMASFRRWRKHNVEDSEDVQEELEEEDDE